MSKCSFSLHKTLTTTRDGENGHHNSPLSVSRLHSTWFPLYWYSGRLTYRAQTGQILSSFLFFINNTEHQFWISVRSLKHQKKKIAPEATNIIKITSSDEAPSESYKLFVEMILNTSTSINKALWYKQFSHNNNVKKKHWDFITQLCCYECVMPFNYSLE